MARWANQKVAPHKIRIHGKLVVAHIYEFKAPSFRVALKALEVVEAGTASAAAVAQGRQVVLILANVHADPARNLILIRQLPPGRLGIGVLGWPPGDDFIFFLRCRRWSS